MGAPGAISRNLSPDSKLCRRRIGGESAAVRAGIGGLSFPTFLTQFDNGSSFTNTPSASTNLAVPNLHPDIIVKAAYDTQLAHRPFHVEVAGLIRSFRVFNTLVTPNRTNTITGGGGAINLNLQLVKNFTLIANSFYSDGGGRYLGGLGPDVIV